MTRVLEVVNLSKRFGGVAAVNGVSFNVEEGEILGIIGPNGCGKTTTFNCILGQLAPSEGEVRLDGRVVTGMRPAALNRLGVSRTFQLLQVFPQLSVRENLILAGQEHEGTMLSRLFGRSDAGLGPAAQRMIGVLQARSSRRRAGGRSLLRPAEAARRGDGVHGRAAPDVARRTGRRRQPDDARRSQGAPAWR